jgi:chromosomal replication initiator protein
MASQSTQLEDTSRLWGEILTAVQGRLGSQQTFETWFKPIQPLRLGPHSVELEVPNSFFVDWIHQHHLPALRAVVAEVLGEEREIRLSTREIAPSASTHSRRPPVEIKPPLGRNGADHQGDNLLHPRYTFPNFVVGSSNQFTHAACRAVAERPGHSYNPLFVFGGSGLGKTHLLHALGHAILGDRPDARVCYVSAERFTNEMIYAIQHAQTLAFRNKYRNVDLLLIDDVQFLAGKESTQEEFFHTFNALRDAHKQIVVTADKPPKDIPKLEERLISRFNQGLVTDIKQPDLETRLAILRKRCAEEGDGIELADDVLLLLADRIRNNIRDLEGCLVRVLALASLMHQDVSVSMVEEILEHYVHPEPDRLAPERILTSVAEAFGVRPEALCGRRRTQSVVQPRQIAMYLLRQFTELSLAEVGQIFGGRDHTTVIYACERIAERLNDDPAFSDKINGLISTLEA